MRVVRWLAPFLLTGVVFGAPEYIKRLERAGDTVRAMMTAADQAIPQDLLDNAECVVIVPGLKRGGFIFGGRYGRGYFFCRNEDGVGWRGPGAIRIEGFNFGLQIGGTEADVVMLVMNRRGMERLFTSRFTIGADMAGAAGPVGRAVEAKTDALLTAEILTYARSRGLFAGVSLDGSTLREDQEINEKLYGKAYTNRQVFEQHLPVPKAAEPVISLLNKYSARKGRK